MKPTLRKPVGVLAIIAGITLYAILIATGAHLIDQFHPLVQTVIYLIFGIIWILPLRPLLIWMETGKWKAS